jgi:lipopolysaccharide biosynthesis glycosyltransferase
MCVTLLKSVYDLEDTVTFDQSNYNYGLVTITSNLFINGTYVLIKSFLYNNPWFKGDIIILYENNYSPLTEHNKNFLDYNISYSIKFKEVNYDNYSTLINQALALPNFKSRLCSSYYTLEILALINSYDKLLYIDSDSVIEGDLQPVFNLDSPIVATPAGGGQKDIRIKQAKKFNGAFILLNQSSYVDFYQLYKSAVGFEDLTQIDYSLADQPILNYLLWDYVYLIHKRFNLGKRIIKDKKLFTKNYINFEKPIKVIHFSGEKPWFNNKTENNYKRAEKIWHKHNDI